MSTALLFFNALLAGNIVLVHLFGVHAQVTFSKRIDVALWLAFIMFYMLSISVPLCYLLHHLLLVPLALTHFQILFYLVINYLCAMLLYRLINWLNPLLHELTVATLPLTICSSLLLGSLLLSLAQLDAWQASLFGIATGVSFAIVLLMMTLLREKLQQVKIPKAFQGLPILVLSMAIISMACTGFSLTVR